MKKTVPFLLTFLLAGMAGSAFAYPGPGGTNVPPVITNYPPQVKITTPGDGSKYPANFNIPICAAAQERGGTITQVEFFSGSTSLGVLLAPPTPTNAYPAQGFFPCTALSNALAGTYSLTAVATDGKGVTATSAPVSITVLAPPPPPPTYPPTVAIVNPTNGSTFYSNATVQVCATAFETNGAVTKVEFFANDASIGVVSNQFGGYGSPYYNPGPTPIPGGFVCLSWPQVAPGDYVLTAVATDKGGISTTSAPVSITVSSNSPPPPPDFPPRVAIVTPDNGERYYANANVQICAAAQDPDGYITSIEFFEGSNSLGVVTAPAPATNSPLFHQTFLCLTWSNVPPGKYQLTAVATDEDGQTGTSFPVNINVGTNTPPPPPVNVPPTVAIVDPTNGASFFADANIKLSALAHDSNGFVVTVEFFEGTNSLGVVTNRPLIAYGGPGPSGPLGDFEKLQGLSLTWSNVASGDYILTAVATDNGGLTATSAPVSITVTTNLPPVPTNRPPKVEIVHPEDGAVRFANTDVDICAAAADGDGYVVTVEFFEGSNSLGVVTNPPPAVTPFGPRTPRARLDCITWPTVAPGDYTLTAVATDDKGASTTSDPVSITVSTNKPPPFPFGH